MVWVEKYCADTGDYVLVGAKPGSAEFGSVGTAFGAKTHVLTEAQMPPHSHNFTYMGAEYADWAYSASGAPMNTINFLGGTNYTANRIGISTKGGGSAHNNLQPSRSTLLVVKA